jgi:hypothetical protein
MEIWTHIKDGTIYNKIVKKKLVKLVTRVWTW